MSELDVATVESQALAYLRKVLGERAPRYITLEREFAEAPLDGEGAAMLFSFDLEPGPGAAQSCTASDRRHYVVAGRTEPNYFPAYGLDADRGYSVHIGTRFMLEMRVAIADPNDEPPGARSGVERFIAEYAAAAPYEPLELAALFRCEDEYFAVYRTRIADTEYYCFGAACPSGAYAMTHLPPQAVLRLHLGQVIRAEARREHQTDR
ncbi:MAG: hypothetical protein D6744_14880 [Planctomycetota bacterium]|nr:MAG: hypothetical protein D6744_14880 [Planctomycetota bacterium]